MSGENINSFFNEKTILVTGGTGFLGKVLIEKLLRDCVTIKRIYVMLRVKDSEDGIFCPSDAILTLEKLKKSKVFDRLKKENPAVLQKLYPIRGDMKECDLKLHSDTVKLLVSEVNVIFHCAASVRFDETLSDAIILNTRGTQKLIKLASKMEKLSAYVHVSTAFSNSNESLIKECVYHPICDYNAVIEACEKQDISSLKSVEKLVNKIFPNTYVFSKNLAERIVYDARHTVPVTIVRPSLSKCLCYSGSGSYTMSL